MIFMNQRELQQKIIAYQLLQKQLEELKKQVMLIENKSLELELTGQAINDLNKTKKGNKVLMPMGNDFYAYGEVTCPEGMLVNIGSGIMIKKDIEASLKFLEEKKRDIEETNRSIQKSLNDTTSKMNIIALEIEKESKNK